MLICCGVLLLDLNSFVFASEAAHGHEAHGLSHTQKMNFLWHCLNFALLAIILVRFLKKPIADALSGRIESIKNTFNDLDVKKKEAEKKYAEYERKLSTLEEEADRILQGFVKQGQAEKEKIIAQAHESAERIKAQAEMYVAQEVAKGKAQLQQEVADMSIKMAKDLVHKNLTEQDHHRLISEYLEKVVTKH
jgi:F-type H+-transporting ATPase subunit b